MSNETRQSPIFSDDMTRHMARHVDTNGDGHLSAMEQVALLGDGMHGLRRMMTQQGVRITPEQKEMLRENLNNQTLSPETLQRHMQEMVGKHLPGGIALLSQEQTDIIAPIVQNLVDDIPTRGR